MKVKIALKEGGFCEEEAIYTNGRFSVVGEARRDPLRPSENSRFSYTIVGPEGMVIRCARRLRSARAVCDLFEQEAGTLMSEWHEVYVESLKYE